MGVTYASADRCLQKDIFFFFNDTATTEIYTLSLHDALPIYNCAEFAIGFLACQKLGVVSSGLNYRLSAAPVGHTVRQEKLKAFIFNSELSDKVAKIMAGADFCRFIGVGDSIPQGALRFDECSGFPTTEPPPVDI